jgi:hypothetical protein
VTRDDFLALAVSFVGCGFSTEPDRFMALIAPGETDAVARSMATHDSTCGLFVRGLLAASGVADSRVEAPYHAGKVMSDLAAMAREAGALLPDLGDAAPGDLIMLEMPEHVFVLESLDGAVLSSIQGGERDATGAQVIARIARSVFGSGRAPLIGGRPVELMIDVEKLIG